MKRILTLYATRITHFQWEAQSEVDADRPRTVNALRPFRVPLLVAVGVPPWRAHTFRPSHYFECDSTSTDSRWNAPQPKQAMYSSTDTMAQYSNRLGHAAEPHAVAHDRELAGHVRLGELATDCRFRGSTWDSSAWERRDGREEG